MDETALGAALVGIVVGLVIALGIGALIGGLFVRWSVRILQGFSPGYGRSVLVAVAVMVVGIVASIALMAAMGAAGMIDMEAMSALGASGAEPDPSAVAAMMGAQAIASLGSLVIYWLLTALFVNLMIRQPDGSAIGFGRSLLIGLLYCVMMIALSIVLVIGLAVLGLGAAGLAMG